MHRPHHIALTACFSQTGDDWCSCSCRKKKYHITPRQVSPSRWILTLILPFLYGLWRLKNLSQVLRQMSPCVELWGAHLEAKAVVPPNRFTALQHTYIFCWAVSFWISIASQEAVIHKCLYYSFCHLHFAFSVFLLFLTKHNATFGVQKKKKEFLNNIRQTGNKNAIASAKVTLRALQEWKSHLKDTPGPLGKTCQRFTSRAMKSPGTLSLLNDFISASAVIPASLKWSNT